MSKLRIVCNNAISRAALTASTTAGTLAVSNLQLDKKSSVWRATATSATLTAAWTALESIACVALPFCNLSPTATVRVRGYSDAAGATLVLDTGAVLASPAAARRPRGWTAAQAASAYANGGGASACVWFAAVSVMRLVVDIVDTNNLQGYVEAACFVAGPYWSPTYNLSAATWTRVDSTELYRTDAGDQGAEAGTIRHKLSIDLRLLPPPDRTAYAAITCNSRAYPILVSVCAGVTDLERERDYTIYGRRTRDAEIAAAVAGAYSTTDEIEEI